VKQTLTVVIIAVVLACGRGDHARRADWVIADAQQSLAAEVDQRTANSRDPCSLLKREEAEAVLGKLVVSPYRTANKGPVASRNGESCAYYTAHHHVLLVTPHWSGGKNEVAALRAVGNIVRADGDNRGAQSAGALVGVGDEAAMDLNGELAFLKGDRLLEISYVTSSTDEAGALRLARTALERLAAARE
jgi:hypothetical protein